MRTTFWGEAKSFKGYRNETLCDALGFGDLDECDSFERNAIKWMLQPQESEPATDPTRKP